MSPAHSRPFKILWITLQMVFALIGSHPESVTAHFRPYISEFQYVPQYHPSRNPDCTSQWQRREFYEGQFEHRNRQRSSFEEPLIDQDQDPWIEIRAVLVRCSKTRKEVKEMYTQPQQNCRRKVIISMKINNVGKTNTREEFVLVDHVFDPIKMRKIRLHNPYVIKVRQEALLHLYGLRFQGIVNAEAREEVINNHRVNFTGCNDGLDNPTCGQMLINGKPIPFSQGFCCSCEDAESFCSVAAESSYYQRDDSANRARNRSESSANLFDNAKAQRQVKTSGNEDEERDRQVVELKNGGTRGRVTSHDIFVNGPLGEGTLSKYRDEKQFGNNSIRESVLSSEGSRWMENANRAETLSPLLRSVFSDPSPASKEKIEAYINAVYERAMKEKADRDKNLSVENNFANFNDPKDRFRERSRWLNDGRSPIHGSVVSDPGNSIAKLTKLKGERDFRNSGKDNRKFLELEERDRSANFSESGNRQERTTTDRSRGAARLENTFDCTPTFLAIQSSRIPAESQFSRQTQRNAFSNASPDNGSLATTIQFFTSSGISLQKDTNENINRNIVPSMIKSYGFEGDGFALSSKIVISGTHRSVESGELIRRYGFRTPENISDNVNLRNALAERRNLSAAAFRNGNARSEEMEVENANVSTRISTVPAFTRLRNLSSSSSSSSSLSSSSIGISRLQELPALTARPGDKSSTEIHESRTRSSLLATNEVQRFSDEFGNLYEGRTIYSSPDQETPRDVNLKNSYKFWKSSPRWKLRKSKGAEKFQRGDKGGSSKRGFEKSLSSRELIWEKRGSPDFKCDTSRNGSWKRERCFQRRPRRHLRIENEDSNSATSENLPEDEDSRREMRAIVDHYARPKVVYSERKMSETGGNGSPKKQVILESGHSYKKVRSAEGDNPFFFNKENGKESNVDKRIEDKFARISNVLKEDSAVVGIIQQTPENLKAATKSKVADISEIQDELRDDSFSRKDDKSYESVATREATSEYPAELIDTRQRSITNENFLAIVKSTTTNNEITAISSPITLKDDSIYKESASLQSREKLSATVIGPFLSSPITRKLSHNVSKKANSDESTSPIYTNTFTMKRTGSDVFASKLSSETPSETLRRNVNDYFAVANESLGTISSNWTNSKETTVYPEAHDNRSESVRDEAENARFLELNKDSSRMIAGNFTEEPRGPAIEADLLLRGSGSITEPRTEASPSDEEGGGEGSYVGDPLRENSVDKFSERSQRSRERDEIAELVDRIVRQYAAYTPLMPDTPTFDEITEAETLPPEDEKTTTTTTVARITTTLATTTRITDATFRPSIRPLLVTTMVLSREMHDEIALDETTFVDETEATTTSLKTTISKREFRRLGRPEGKGRRVSSEIGKGEKRQRTVNRLANMTDAEGEAEDHPWYRTTEMQQIIAANGSKSAQRVEDPRRKNQRYKSKSDYFPNASSTTISSSVADDVTLAQTRNRRSDFIRESSDRDFTIFYDYVEEDNEDRAQNGRRTALSKDGKSPDMTTAPSELRSRIEKGLAGEFNYSANWKSFRRRGCESPERTQKHNAAPRDIATRDVERQANNRDGRYLDSNAREKERNAQDSLRNFALLKLRHVKDDAVDRYDEDVIARSREAISASLEIPFPAKIPTSRKDFSGSVRKRIDRRAAARIDRIASNPLENLRTASANADDLSNRGAESATSRILTGRGKSSGDQDDKGRQTDTVIRGAKLMMADDKGETSRDVFAAAKSADKKIPSSFHGAKQWKRKDAKRKINENPPRVHRAFAYDTVRETIGKIERGRKSSSVPDERNIAGSDESADRSLTDRWRRSGRRLLSSGKSYSYVEDAENEYYEDDGSETDGESDSASDNEAVAGRDDLSDLENQPVLREDRDSRKLLPETDRLADENTDAARTVMPEERTVAARDAAVVPDVQGVSEGAISRNNGKEVMDKNIDLEEKHDIEAELADPASFNDDKKKSFDESENTLRNFRIYEKIDEEPLSFREKISEDDIRDESLYETQPASMIFDTKEITTSRSLSGVGKTHENVDLSQNPITSKGEGSIKISLTGRIQVGGGFNQTPMLISFDAIPDGSSATRSSLSTELSNSIVAVETTAINLPDSNAGSTFDLPSIIEHANDEASDSMNVTADENREEVGRTNTNEVARKSREKFFDLAGGSEGEEDGRRKTAETDSSRIEKRLDKYGANSRTAKQIFLTDCSKSSIASSGEMDRTSVSRTTISERTDEVVDKLDPPASANVVRFPNILGSVLIDKDSREDQNHAKEETSRCRVDVPVGEANRSEIDRSNTTDLHVPLLRVRIEKPRVDSTNDERDGIAPCPGEDSRNVTSGGCYRIPATVRKLQLPETTVRELQQTWSNYHDSDSTQQTFPLDIQEATTNDRNAGRFSSSTRSEDDVLDQLTTGYATGETFPTETPCDRCDGESINAIRVRNMMAIVRFMMKLLRIIADEEEPPCLRTRAGETVIRVKNVIVNASSRTGNNVGKQKSATDRTTMMSERERQNFTTTERRSTITERIREKTSPLNGDTFVSEASTLPSSSDEAFKNEVLSTLFQTSTRRKVHASTLSRTTFSATPKSFLFYELERKPALREDVSSRKDIPQLTDVEQNSSVSFNDSKEDSEVKKSSRLDDGQTNRSRPRNQDRSSADRLRLGKQEIVFATNFKRKKIGPESLREEYSARDKNVGFRTPRSTGVANDTVRSMRDTGVPRDALLEVIDAAIREDGLARTRRKSKAAGISDRRDTRTKLLNSSGGGGGSPGDWIGEHRATATRRLAVDKKLRESREVPGGIAAPEKVVFRRVRGEINPYPRDPNLGGGASDSSVKIEEHVPGNGPLAKLSTDEAPPTVSGDSGSLKRADSTEKARAIRYSSTSSVSDNVGASKIGEEVANEVTSAPSKKPDVGFRKGNRAFRKRQRKLAGTTKRKTKWRKTKRKKGGQRIKDISGTGNQRSFRRHLLMASLEPEYDADDAAARLSGRYVIGKRDAVNFRKLARGDAERRGDESRKLDGSEVDPGSRAQIRGGQDCADRGHPPNIDAAKYLESAHCLRFSDLWYSVYQLEDPIVEHTVYLQVYEKRTLGNGSIYWEDLTRDSVVRLGTFNRHHRGNQDTIAFAYRKVKMPGRREEEMVPNLDVVRDRLLVPSSVTSKGSGYPVEGESNEYLVVPASSINENGNECDKAGVGFAAFAKQPDRCGHVSGTCLKNQPLAYRKHDAEARAAGRPGCYFLSNFASVPSEPIKYSASGSGSREFLALEYHSPHVSAIDIELGAGYNAALAGGSMGRISQVNVNSTALDHTVVTIVITNTGLIPTSYQSKIADCPDSLPESWVNATFPKRLVQPRRNQAVSLNLYGELPINEFYCSVQLLNRLGEPVATRKIKIRKMDRCFCTQHCLCVCVGDARGTSCQPMPLELYHAAGFRGPLPSYHRQIFSDTTLDVIFFIVSLILLLLLIGFLKWFIGLYIPAMGRWGLDSLLETSIMSEYFERELKYKRVVRDEHGAPVHPDTRKRTVRICSRKAEFFLNAMFFLIFPFAVCCYRLKRFFRPDRKRCYSNESKISLTTNKSEHTRTICVNTYGDSRDSQMEAEDIKYVMDEFKKSEESLRNHNRSKRNRCTKEYRSCH